MMRLVDYFAVIGYDSNSERGIILQRFPSKDWSDVPFVSAVELFCQPQGWKLSAEKSEPQFFVSVFTDLNGDRHYCACLSFMESVELESPEPLDEEDENNEDGGLDHYSTYYPSNSFNGSGNSRKLFAPKCLVIMSRLYQVEAFRNCLGTIYTVYADNISSCRLETLVGNLVGSVQVPTDGGPQVVFTLGAGDRQAIQPPANSTIPVTHSTVAQLFNQLGIKNGLTLFCAVMTEQKILFHSRSLTRLTDACHALTSLMYPFKYSHVYVPLLPSSITEVASSPTPFIIGVHSSARHECSDMMDVIVSDLDDGSVKVPDSLSIPVLPSILWSEMKDLLATVLQPELSYSDYVFPPLAIKPSTPNQLDKEIRSIFLRMFARLLQGYRCCLVIIRIHPKPVITFDNAKFLGQRGLVGDEFVSRLLECMFFGQFISERGCPWRPCDIWDDLYSNFENQTIFEKEDPRRVMIHIQEIAKQLATNETPNCSSYVSKLLKPAEVNGCYTRSAISNSTFPTLDEYTVDRIIQESYSKEPYRNSITMKQNQPRIVPFGPKTIDILDSKHIQIVDNSARKLEVLRNCVDHIFENKITDARRTIHAVTRALKSKATKLALCQELEKHVSGNKAILEPQQFDMVVKLMHYALQDNTPMDECGVASALLPLATTFCRKLCPGVIQFAYSSIQEHAVWKNLQFWESCFYADVQNDVKKLYLSQNETVNHNYITSAVRASGFGFKEEDKGYRQKTTALEIAAEQLRTMQISQENSKKFVNNEESTVYSQAIHYANRIVYLLVPMDVPSYADNDPSRLDEEMSSNITSMAESASIGCESGFGDHDPFLESRSHIVRTVSRFVDKVCTEGLVTEDHIRSLHMMIPGIVDMHIETLDAVRRESKRLPPVQKPKIPNPYLLPGEVLKESLRAFLLSDGREHAASNVIGGPILLPSEGALFLTNYRIVFKGAPTDPYSCEQTVIRSFPVCSLTKDKKIQVPVESIAHLDHKIQEGLQLRSSTFQLMKIAFDEEVTGENVDCFRKALSKLRHPQDVFSYFALCSPAQKPPVTVDVMKDKNTTLRNFAKKTILRTAKKTGIKSKSSKSQKYELRGWAQGNGGTLPANTKYSTPSASPSKHLAASHEGDDISLSEEESHSVSNAPNDMKNIERIMERSYCKDWKRMGLYTANKGSGGGHGSYFQFQRADVDSFKLCTVNLKYQLCRTYPALFIVPNTVTDPSIRKISRLYRSARFPVATWRHPRNKGVLIRGASFSSKRFMAFLKGNNIHNSSQVGPATMRDSNTSHVEQDIYFRCLVNATPTAVIKHDSAWAITDSSLSLELDDTYKTCLGGGSAPFSSDMGAVTAEFTPEFRKKGFMKVVPPLRTSGGKGGKQYGTVSKTRKPSSSTGGSLSVHCGQRLSSENRELVHSDTMSQSTKAGLYVLGEKTQMKGMKSDPSLKVEFVPVEYADFRQTKGSFKKLMRACLPSSSVTDPQNSFLKGVESSEWMNQLSSIMKLAGAIVDLIDFQGSSVMLCLEEGSDITSQVSSIAQLCMDPYYRTVEGFRVLIEKEWLAFGHKFAQRNNATGIEGPSSNPGFTPIFLQFLDIVFQIQNQFPASFEFSQFYLKFLAYHSVSARFRTFLADSEYERYGYNFTALDDRRDSMSRHYKEVDGPLDEDNLCYLSTARPLGTNSQSHNLGQSIFDYIEKQHAKHPIFYNFMYEKDSDTMVLRPMSGVSNLEIWDYYVNEHLSCGAPYDLEIAQSEAQGDDERHDMSKEKEHRKFVMSQYDVVENVIPSSFALQLHDFRQWETEEEILPQKWKLMWDRVDLQEDIKMSKKSSFKREVLLMTERVRSLVLSIHKKNTIDILVRGKLAKTTEFSNVYANSHRFDKQTYTAITHCDICSNLLLGKNAFRCNDCGVKCHEKCADAVPTCGSKYSKAMAVNSINAATPVTNSVAEHSPGSTNATNSKTVCPSYYDQFQSAVEENRTHEGYLYKRGALLKGWKQRWFVLDSMKHQLRYYDSNEDASSKGVIELSDVASISLSNPLPGAPKKADEKSFFDIRTAKRVYNLCAPDASAAQDWIDKIKAFL